MAHRHALTATALALVLGAAGVCASAAAAEGTKAERAREPALGRYLQALRAKRLLQTEAAQVAELRSMLAKAESLALSGRHEDAVVLLYELVESPRFADYEGLEEMSAARYVLGTSLHALGAEASARRYLRHVIDQGPDNPYFAPAFRAYGDVALASHDLAAVNEALAQLPFPLPEDAKDEQRYLRGRERLEHGDDARAKAAFAEISTRSRFYGSAQYLLGAIAARGRSFRAAERHFCKVATGGDSGRFSFFVDQRYFKVKDLARLGLGRVAHEERRSDDAFYYYFQVPQDSSALPEAMFEAAYATYEGGDHDTALDLLDQLEARFPRSPFSDEAAILRGYAALSGCEFEKARKHFTRFIDRFSPLADEIERVLENPARRTALYRTLAQSEREASAATSVDRTLLELLRVDPRFSDLHQRVQQLDAEAARAGRLPEVIAAIEARLSGSDAPRPSARAAAEPSLLDELGQMKARVLEAREALSVLTGQLDAMRRLGAKKAELRPLERNVAALLERTHALEDRIADARFASSSETQAAESRAAGDVDALFADDLAMARAFSVRVERLRPRLLSYANELSLRELSALGERLHGFLRRARIGRIDAIMGSKRRIEKQIEKLSQGVLPAELSNPLRIQGFLADDEEYWPFEGEDWPDEYIDNYGASDRPGAK